MMQGMGREMWEIRRDNGALRLEMKQDICEMQQKIMDISTTASNAVIRNLTSGSGHSIKKICRM